jgi:hypothetical protein
LLSCIGSLRHREFDRVSQLGKAPKQVGGIQTLALTSGEIGEYLTAVHHYGTVALLERLLHAVRDHHCRKRVLTHHLIRDTDNLLGRAGIERSSVFIEQ